MGFVRNLAQVAVSPAAALFKAKGKKATKTTGSLASPGFNSADVGNGTGPQLMRRI